MSGPCWTLGHGCVYAIELLPLLRFNFNPFSLRHSLVCSLLALIAPIPDACSFWSFVLFIATCVDPRSLSEMGPSGQGAVSVSVSLILLTNRPTNGRVYLFPSPARCRLFSLNRHQTRFFLLLTLSEAVYSSTPTEYLTACSPPRSLPFSAGRCIGMASLCSPRRLRWCHSVIAQCYTVPVLLYRTRGTRGDKVGWCV